MQRNRSIVINSSLNGLNSLLTQLDEVCRDWNIDKKICLELNLILEELIVNYVIHSNHSSLKQIEVELSLLEKEFIITVVDDGPPFNPHDIPAPDTREPLEQRKPGGLGIHIIRHFANQIIYERKDDKNFLTISKYL